MTNIECDRIDCDEEGRPLCLEKQDNDDKNDSEVRVTSRRNVVKKEVAGDLSEKLSSRFVRL